MPHMAWFNVTDETTGTGRNASHKPNLLQYDPLIVCLKIYARAKCLVRTNVPKRVRGSRGSRASISPQGLCSLMTRVK